MKTLTWKSMLAALNPSPLFEAVAAFVEELATRASIEAFYNVRNLSHSV